MYIEANRAAWAEIDLGLVQQNAQEIIRKAGGADKVIGVIKADAYGHGAVNVAPVLAELGISTFAVATIPEAIELRQAGFTSQEIIPFSLTADPLADVVTEYDLTPPVCSYHGAALLSEAAGRRGKTVYGYIAVDTGMGRIGFDPDDPETIEDVMKISELENFRIRGLFSHLSTADEKDKTYAQEQTRRYKEFADALEEKGIVLPVKTLANSAALIDMPETYFDKCRAGLILFGYYPSDQVMKEELPLKPVMSVKANILQLKKVREGAAVSYNRSFIAKRDSLIATIPIGYADGLPRLYSKGAEVIVKGVKAPVAGNINMDQCMIDVTDVPGVREGDEVTIIGRDGSEVITADDIAKATKTIPNEVLCGLGQRLYKKYIEPPK